MIYLVSKQGVRVTQMKKLPRENRISSASFLKLGLEIQVESSFIRVELFFPPVWIDHIQGVADEA